MLELPAEQSYSPLRVKLETQFHFDRLGARVGHLEGILTIKNLSSIPASVPFVAFSAIGLKWTSLDGWIQELWTGRQGRNMTRFRMGMTSALQGEESARPCKLMLPVAMEHGCSIRILPGVIEPLATLSDMTLHYIVGAGNFPTTRSSLVIPATEMTSKIGVSFPWLQRTA